MPSWFLVEKRGWGWHYGSADFPGALAGSWRGSRVAGTLLCTVGLASGSASCKVIPKRSPGAPTGFRLPQELPEQWTNTKKLAIQVKQNVAPLQANEVSILRRRCQQFEVWRRTPPSGVVTGGGDGAAEPGWVASLGHLRS